MVAAFACPECGAELELTGLTPGREVQCAFCETWVEVPYLPRAASLRRKRFGPQGFWDNTLFVAGAAGLGILILSLLTWLLIRTKARADHEREVGTLLESAESAANSGRFDVALFETEAALARMRSFEEKPTERIREVERRRNDISKREVQSRLQTLRDLPPASAVGACLTLQERSRIDPALKELSHAIHEALEASRLRLALDELVRGRGLLKASKPAEAFEVGDSVAKLVELLPRGERAAIRERSEALLRDVVAAFGVVPFALQGQYTLGSMERYQAALLAMSVEALKRKGYFPPPPKTTRRDLWDAVAPFQMRLIVRESQTGFYLQSHDRVSLIELQASLVRSGRDLWVSLIVGRTRVPLPNLPAYLASRLAVSDRRDPEVERRLYDDALDQIRDQFGPKLRGLPPCVP